MTFPNPQRLIALAALPALLAAAGPTGDWYGTLNTPVGDLRIVLHVAQADGNVTATLDSIDQGAMGIPSTASRLDGNKVMFEFARVRGKLEGEANADATELTGTWTQGPGTLPVKFTRQKFVIKEVAAVPLTPAERDFLISHLEKSRKEFLDSIRGVTKEQWSFKAAPDRWSIGECAEHLVTTEDALFGLVSKQIMKAPTREGARKGQADDEKVIARTVDRSQKAKAPEMLVPSGKYNTPEDVEKAFNPRRDNSIQYVKTTTEDLRGRSSGPMDAYQYLVMMSAHTLRHTAQLNEVKTDPKFPK
jgi:hypothetical protein